PHLPSSKFNSRMSAGRDGTRACVANGTTAYLLVSEETFISAVSWPLEFAAAECRERNANKEPWPAPNGHIARLRQDRATPDGDTNKPGSSVTPALPTKVPTDRLQPSASVCLRGPAHTL